jgi:hypothetical protein
MLSGPRSTSVTFQKIWQRQESNAHLWISSQELRSVDHRGGHHYLINIEYLGIMNYQTGWYSYYALEVHISNPFRAAC